MPSSPILRINKWLVTSYNYNPQNTRWFFLLTNIWWQVYGYVGLRGSSSKNSYMEVGWAIRQSSILTFKNKIVTNPTTTQQQKKLGLTWKCLCEPPQPTTHPQIYNYPSGASHYHLSTPMWSITTNRVTATTLITTTRTASSTTTITTTTTTTTTILWSISILGH